jgi:two-component system, OmpR family, phosphate regulon sensor histidine kinase PhoR
MKNSLQRITFTFIAIALLPIGYILYELSLLSKNEKIVRDAYQNQLDAILYSVNQYSDDIMSSWANGVSLKLQKAPLEDTAQSIKSVLNQAEVVNYLYLTDMNGRSVVYKFSDWGPPEDKVRGMMDGIAEVEKARINKLVAYEAAGFRKMDPVDTAVFGNSIPILFSPGQDSEFEIGALIVDLPAFISHVLAPKMQSISQEKFIITAFRFTDDTLIYSTESAPSPVNPLAGDQEAAPAPVTAPTTASFADKQQKKDFWLLPGYYLGISVKGATIDDLVKERITTSIIILGLLVVLLAVGIWFLHHNIRREIHLSQAKSEFVSNVSHEIRTPLSLIGMFAETLEMDRVKTEEKKKEYYQIIGKETARLSRIVNRILNFSQLDAGKKRFNFESIAINDLCREILDPYADHLKAKGFIFSFLGESRLPPIQGDRESVSEAIINLLDNAVKYSREDKVVRVRTLIDHEYVYIEVTDKGIGIDRYHQREIFDQFYRAPTGDVHTTKGTGLGLTLVKKIMEAHHGKVSVESIPDKGSTFKLAFPLITPKTA